MSCSEVATTACFSRSLPTKADRSILASPSRQHLRVRSPARELTERCAMAALAVYAAGLSNFQCHGRGFARTKDFARTVWSTASPSGARPEAVCRSAVRTDHAHECRTRGGADGTAWPEGQSHAVRVSTIRRQATDCRLQAASGPQAGPVPGPSLHRGGPTRRLPDGRKGPTSLQSAARSLQPECRIWHRRHQSPGDHALRNLRHPCVDRGNQGAS